MQYPSPQEVQREQAAKGARLVTWSRLGALAGFLVLIGGCGGAIAAHTAILAYAGSFIGFALLVTAAIIGQIGRAYQGRVI